MSVWQRGKYDSDFKRNAVLLFKDLGRTISELADNLGIAKELLYRW
jgi:transposase/putative transposase